MSKAVLCPVCGGTGKVTPQTDWKSNAIPQPKTCHGCSGKGWVEVGKQSARAMSGKFLNSRVKRKKGEHENCGVNVMTLASLMGIDEKKDLFPYSFEG